MSVCAMLSVHIHTHTGQAEVEWHHRRPPPTRGKGVRRRDHPFSSLSHHSYTLLKVSRGAGRRAGRLCQQAPAGGGGRREEGAARRPLGARAARRTCMHSRTHARDHGALVYTLACAHASLGKPACTRAWHRRARTRRLGCRHTHAGTGSGQARMHAWHRHARVRACTHAGMDASIHTHTGTGTHARMPRVSVACL